MTGAISVAFLRASKHRLAQILARTFVNVVFCVPLPFLILFVYAALLRLPTFRVQMAFGYVELSNRGAVATIDRASAAVSENTFGVPIEFVALAACIGVSCTAHLAEAIRGSIDAIPVGQTEAAKALGLGQARIFFRILCPQALPGIAPAASNIFAGSIRATSFGVLIGYPDVFMVAITAGAQTGRVAEIIFLVGLLYGLTVFATFYFVSVIVGRMVSIWR